jgi:hypothetical protein
VFHTPQCRLDTVSSAKMHEASVGLQRGASSPSTAPIVDEAFGTRAPELDRTGELTLVCAGGLGSTLVGLRTHCSRHQGRVHEGSCVSRLRRHPARRHPRTCAASANGRRRSHRRERHLRHRLHFVRSTEPGTILGHEALRVVEQIGKDVRNLRPGDRATGRPGDRVIVPSTVACGYCAYCRVRTSLSAIDQGVWLAGASWRLPCAPCWTIKSASTAHSATRCTPAEDGLPGDRRDQQRHDAGEARHTA